MDEIRVPEKREASSRNLAHFLGASDLIFFIEDPLLKVYLPAQGYPQTMPSGKNWRAFLEAVRRNEDTVCELVSPYSGNFELVKGFVISETALLVVVGSPPKLKLSGDVKVLFGLVAAALVGETALIHSEGQSKTLRESADMYRALVSSMEATKRELHRILKERDQALRELQENLQQKKNANEIDAKILNGTQTLLSTLDFEATLKNIVTIATDHLSDWCVIYLRRDRMGPTMTASAVAAKDPKNLSAIQDYIRQFPDVSGGPTPVGQVIETRSEKTFEGLSLPRILALTETEEQGIALDRCHPRALLAHPLTHGGDFIGVLVYGFTERDAGFSTSDLLLAQRWTGQATSALTNATLFREAQKAIAARDELMSISSHEIRTPITAMKLQIQLAKRQIEKLGPGAMDPARMVKLIEQSDSQLRKLTKLVDDMLDLSRINTGRFSFDLQRVNLSEIVLDTLDRLGAHLTEAGCQVESSVDSRVMVRGDISRLEQMLTNLLTNAARYGARRPIEVCLRKCHGQAVLSVRDHGDGVAPADRERIFGKFERAVSRNEVSGLGLGLFIVREIMHSHGGLIRVEGEKGEGATFIAELPLYKTSEMGSEAVASHDVTNLGGRS